MLAGVAAVLIVIDAQVHLLPGRLVYPAAAVIAAAALCSRVADQLLRAVLAAAAAAALVVGRGFLGPAAIGLGDVRLMALPAGILGCTS